MNNEYRDRIERARRRSQERASRQAALAAGRGQVPVVGDLLLSPSSGSLGLLWLVLQPHPDRADLFYLLPVDGAPWAGSADLELGPWSSTGPLVIRCGLGFWAEADALQGFSRAAVVEPEDVQRARRALGLMVRECGESTALQREHDRDPEYEEWMGKVQGEAQATQALLQPAAQVISLSAFRRGKQPEGGRQVPLAAASSHEVADFDPQSLPLACDLPGELTLVAHSPFEMSLLYEAEDGQEQPPPQIYVEAEGELVLVRWLDALASVHASETTLALNRGLVLLVEGQQIKLEP